MSIEWLEPWRPIEDPSLGQLFTDELARELAAAHPLAGLPLVAIGQHASTSDFLFKINDGSGRLALVHLTWTGQREKPPWPLSMMFANEVDWMEQGMRPDHDETAPGSRWI